MGYCEQDLASLLENMPTPFSEAQVCGLDLWARELENVELPVHTCGVRGIWVPTIHTAHRSLRSRGNSNTSQPYQALEATLGTAGFDDQDQCMARAQCGLV